MSMFNMRRGTALMEYALPLGLVMLLCVGALVQLGSVLSGQLAGFAKGVRVSPTQSVADPSPTISVAGTVAIAVPSSPLPGPSAGYVNATINLGNGKTITLAKVPKDGGQIVETLGSNGYTRSLADTLLQLNRELLAAGEISPVQSNLLTRLANQGHEIANIEKLLEDGMAASGGANSGFLDKTVMYNGQVRNYYDLLNVITSGAGSDFHWYTEYSSMSSYPDASGRNPENVELNKFLSLYDQVGQSGMLSNPVVQQIVEQLSFQIAHSGNTLADTAYSYGAGDMTLSVLKQTTISTASHDSSGGICATGGGVDSGVQCQ